MRLTNFYEPEGDNRYYVFTYATAELADEFQAHLEAKSITFQRHFDDEAGHQNAYLFGVSRSDLKQVMWCNHMVYARHRKKFISHGFLRWFLLLFTFGLVALAIIGYFKSR
jgi:hypothetical protein